LDKVTDQPRVSASRTAASISFDGCRRRGMTTLPSDPIVDICQHLPTKSIIGKAGLVSSDAAGFPQFYGVERIKSSASTSLTRARDRSLAISAANP
jgi:hypothetical protein